MSEAITNHLELEFIHNSIDSKETYKEWLERKLMGERKLVKIYQNADDKQRQWISTLEGVLKTFPDTGDGRVQPEAQLQAVHDWYWDEVFPLIKYMR